MRHIFWTALILSGLACACGDKITVIDEDDGGSGGSGAGGDDTPPVIDGPGQPPPPPDVPFPPDGAGAIFGASQMFYGGTDRNGSPNPSAWKAFGYNLDGLVSIAGDPNHCQPSAGGKPTVMDDGDAGVDNAWGRTIMPLMLSLANDLQEQANANILNGDANFLFEAVGVGGSSNYTGVELRAYHGASLGFPPSFDGTGTWQLAPESLSNPIDPTSARWRFAQSYVTGDVLVSSPRTGTYEIFVPIAGVLLRLPIQNAIISMRMSSDRNTATGGIIAGIIPTEVMVEAVRDIAASFSVEFCTGTTIESLLDQVRQTSDILSDGSQDPSRSCDAISIGVGFDAVRFGIDGIGQSAPPIVDPCQ